MSKSLALHKFTKAIEAEIRCYWQISSALIYSERWWTEHIEEDNYPDRITQYPGDDVNPFNSIDIPPREFIGNIPNVVKFTIENTIINLITTFEVYLFDITKRIIYLDPDIIDQSGIQFEANEIAIAIKNADFKDWFAEKVTSKYIRNKTHLKMFDKVQKFAKCDLKSHKDLLEEWNKWTYVRNAIIHNGREVSEDLQRVWPERFPSINKPLEITEREINRVIFLAIKILNIIDKRAVKTTIKDSDGVLLIRELFMRNGTEETNELAKSAFDILNVKLKTQTIEKAISQQKKNGVETYGWSFSHYDFMK